MQLIPKQFRGWADAGSSFPVKLTNSKGVRFNIKQLRQRGRQHYNLIPFLAGGHQGLPADVGPSRPPF